MTSQYFELHPVSPQLRSIRQAAEIVVDVGGYLGDGFIVSVAPKMQPLSYAVFELAGGLRLVIIAEYLC